MSQTGAGEGVTTHVTTDKQLRRAVPEAMSVGGGGAIVEEYIAGDTFRMLYLDGELLDVVVRRPAHVVGDGRHDVRSLVRAENRRRRALGDGSTGPVPVGLELAATLAAQGRTAREIPSAGETVVVSGRSNTGDATASRSVLGSCHDDVRDTGARAAAALGVRLAGVDVITTDIERPLTETGGVVNEVNTTPGLHWHYLVAADSPVVPVAEIIAARILDLPQPPSATARSPQD
jgi:cyanophycin synthetase